MQGRLSALATMVKDRPGTLLLALTLLALVLRLAWGLGALADDRSLVNEGDYTSYHQAARHFLKRGNFNNSHFLVRPPAFTLLVALAGLNAALVIAFNALIGALLTPLTWLLTRRLGLAQGGALLAALLVAIDPLSIRYTAFLGPGSLAFAGALAMMVGLLAMLQARTQGRAILWAALAALMMLLSVYARPSIYALPLILVLWLLWTRRARWPAIMTFALISLAGMQVWVNHNATVLGNATFSTVGTWTLTYYRAVPVLRLASGMSVEESEAHIDAAVQTRLGGDPASANRQDWLAAAPEVEQALQDVSLQIFRDHPVAWLATFPTGFLRLYNLVPPLWPRSELFNPVHYPLLLWNWMLLLLAIIGLWRLLRERRWLLFWCLFLVIGYFSAGTLLVKSAGMSGRESRVVLPFLAIAAVCGAQWLLPRLRKFLRR
ncbi:MAG: hypothetical protein OXF44_02660 [Anaerolineaceae bacterium]|nr:hypothetical protein [Anaerolineaceae bacterium]MCY4022515.1 hypothetical protein [Anaerolineaceae bacterium]